MQQVLKNDQDFLGNAPVGKLLFKLALPAIIAQVINVLYNVVDRMYIGHIEGVGGLALTGLGVCAPIIIIVSAFASFASMGGAPLASIELGKNNREGAEKILGSCFALQVTISLILMVVLLIWNEPLLMLFGASENTIEYASGYMSIYAIGTIFVQLTLGMNAYITAQGHAKTSMITVLIGALLNIALDPLFIFVFKMGVKGAALATIISQAVSCLWATWFMISKKSSIRLRLKNIRYTKVIINCIALGVSPFVMQASESVISICFNSSLLKYGGDVAVGAMTILTMVMQFAMLPLQGLAQGAQPISSYNFGARNPDRVKKTFKILLISCLSYSTVLWVLVEAMPGVFAKMFTSDLAIIEYTTFALRIYAGALVVMGAQIACQMTFISLGNAKASAFLAILRKFILLLPLIYIMPLLTQGNKALGVFLAEPIADVIAVATTIILFVFEFKKAIKKISTVETQEPSLEGGEHLEAGASE